MPGKRLNVLMVCLGNICRSPLAEGIFRAANEAAGWSHVIDSAGTSAYHVGKAPDPRSIRVASEASIDITQLKARQLSLNDFSDFDHIFVMDDANLRHVLAMQPSGSDALVSKVTTLLPRDSVNHGIDVPDPYYGGIDDFYAVLDLLKLTARSWIERCSSK